MKKDKKSTKKILKKFQRFIKGVKIVVEAEDTKEAETLFSQYSKVK